MWSKKWSDIPYQVVSRILCLCDHFYMFFGLWLLIYKCQNHLHCHCWTLWLIYKWINTLYSHCQSWWQSSTHPNHTWKKTSALLLQTIIVQLNKIKVTNFVLAGLFYLWMHFRRNLSTQPWCPFIGAKGLLKTALHRRLCVDQGREKNMKLSRSRSCLIIMTN